MTKKGFERIVAWRYEGHTAVGVLYKSEDFISVAVGYFMDSNIKECDLWFMDSINKDEGTGIRPATDLEIERLVNALDGWKIPYKYDKKTKTIRNYDVYPTWWMKFKQWIKELLI